MITLSSDMITVANWKDAEMPRTLEEDRSLEKYKAQLNTVLQQQKIGADFATLAIRSIITVSSGAIILLGNLWRQSGEVTITRPIVVPFALSLCLGVLTSIVAYLSALAQHYRHSSPSTWIARHARGVRWTAIIIGVLAFAMFALGVMLAIIPS